MDARGKCVGRANEMQTLAYFVNGVLGRSPVRPFVEVRMVKQDWGTPQLGQAVSSRPMCLNGRGYPHGIGTHADSELRIVCTRPVRRFRALAGLDDMMWARQRKRRVYFSVEAAGKELWRSPVLTVADDPAAVDVDLGGVTEFTLKAWEESGEWDWTHLDWAEAAVVLDDGQEIVIGSDDDHGWLLPTPPISFKYGNADSRSLLPAWERTYRRRELEKGITLHELQYRDSKTGLVSTIEMKQFADFPAVEWVMRFKNTGSRDTPILSDIQALDLRWLGFASPQLYWSKGSGAMVDDFLYQHQPIALNNPVVLAPVGGRSSSVGAVPFFNVAKKDGGFVAAVGWTGQWQARLEYDGYILRVRSGMEKTHLTLHPGEEIRTPSILLVFWDGADRMRGHNLLRRMILEHYMRRPDGKTIPAPVSGLHWGGMKTQTHLDLIKLYRENHLNLDYYWIDAAWYGPEGDYCPDVFTGNWASNVGYWEHNPTAHPRGLRPISDAAHAAGYKFLLWFEPERACPGTPWPSQYPQWFLNQVLFNLGLPDARRFLTDFISEKIREYGIDCYRQDFNADPLPFWRAADAPDRQGMAEIRHIEGLYEFWDELLRRHPGLLIDNCASGGRRIDLETIRRSIPLWRSDFVNYPDKHNPVGCQVETLGLAHWVPCSACGTSTLPGDTYNFRSSMCTGVTFSIHEGEFFLPKPGDTYDWHRKMIADLRRAIPYFLGDYYPLKEGSASPEDWAAYQFHREDLNAGMIMLLRRDRSPFAAAEFCLRGLDDATYQLENADTGETSEFLGRDAKTTGLRFTIDRKRDSRLLFYRRKS